jgi:hypothetical protein
MSNVTYIINEAIIDLFRTRRRTRVWSFLILIAQYHTSMYRYIEVFYFKIKNLGLK